MLIAALMNNADNSVNTYACKNATNNSKQLRAVDPKTAKNAVTPQVEVGKFAALTAIIKIAINTK